MGFLKLIRHAYFWLNTLRYFFLGYFKRNRISFSSKFRGNSYLSHTTIGKYNYVGPNCILNDVVTQNYCSIAPNVQIGGMEHDYRQPSTSTFIHRNVDDKKVYIADDVWIGAGAIIRRGVRIGRGAVIGAGAIVLKDVDAYTIVVGNPAKFMKKRFAPPQEKALEKSDWWNHPPKVAQDILDQIIQNN